MQFLRTRPRDLCAVQVRWRRPGKRYLDLNEPMLTSERELNIRDEVVKFGTEVLTSQYSQYSRNGELDLCFRQTMAKYLSDHLSAENLLVTRGSDAGLAAVFGAFSGQRQQSRVCVFDPTYSTAYDMLVGRDDVISIPFPSSNRISLSDSLAAAKPVHLAYLCNPNNPVGFSIDRKEVLEAIDDHPDIMFVVDEAYAEYVDPQREVSLFSVRSGCGELRPNVVVTRTFSKAFGLAGIRLGVLIAVPEVLDVVRRRVCPTEVTDAAKAMGLRCLQPDALEVFHDYFERTRKLRSWVVNMLQAHVEAKGKVSGRISRPIDNGYVGVIISERLDGMFVALEVADESVSERLAVYLDEVWNTVVARRTFFFLGKERHALRCQIGDKAATESLVKGIVSFFVPEVYRNDDEYGDF